MYYNPHGHAERHATAILGIIMTMEKDIREIT